MKVLVAEDDPDQLELRTLLLRRAGFETIGAATGVEALDAARTASPPCAVIDLRFPSEECGLGLIQGLKAIDPAIHIFVLTGGDLKRLKERAEWSLVDAAFVKGSPSSALLLRLKEIERQRPAAAAMTRPPVTMNDPPTSIAPDGDCRKTSQAITWATTKKKTT